VHIPRAEGTCALRKGLTNSSKQKLGEARSPVMSCDPPTHVFVGCYTNSHAHIRGDKTGDGVYVLKLNGDGSLTHLSMHESVDPSFVCSDGRFLYAANEIEGGGVTAFSIDQASGALTKLNERATGGDHTCHLMLNGDSSLVVAANYSGGSVACFPIGEDGSLGERGGFMQFEGTGPDAARQEAAHAHQSVFSASGAFVYVPDLGSDKVRQLRVAAGGALEEIPGAPSCEVAVPGCGPRHLAFHPALPFAYNIHEMGNSVSALSHDAGSGRLAVLQTLSTLPEGYEGVREGCTSLTKSHCADVHVSPDGRFLYGSNRGHDSIVIFAIDQAAGTLSLVGHTYVGGSIPRSFGITPNGEFMLVACQDTHTINTFAVDKATGLLTNTGHTVEVGSPVCVCFAALG